MRNVSLSSLPIYLQEAYDSLETNSCETEATVDSIDVQNLNDIQSLPSIQERYFHLLLRRHDLTEQLAEFGKCYPPTILERAQTYEALEYDDLAAFDGYVIYTLCQKELSDEFVTDLEAHSLDGEKWHPPLNDVKHLMIQSLALLVRCLARLGALDDARVKRVELRGLIASDMLSDRSNPNTEDEVSLLRWQPILRDSDYDVNTVQNHLDSPKTSKFGMSRREIYPWSPYEPARNTPESLIELNSYLSTIAPNLEAKVTALPAFDTLGNATDEVSYQLGLFAKTDLEPGQEILAEKSILTAIRPLEDALCDACGCDLEGISFEEVAQCDGEDCDVTFCSQDCKDRAVRGYHRPNLGGTEDEGEHDEDENENEGDEDEEYEDIDNDNDEEHSDPVNTVANKMASTTLIKNEEHQTKAETETDTSSEPDRSSQSPICGNTDLSLIGRPTTSKTPEWDLYFLLLTRTLAMSLTQSIHPLLLTEIKHLWGDFSASPSPFLTDPSNSIPATHTPVHSLPFSLSHTITLPLDYLTTLSLSSQTSTPYSPPWLATSDTWILQTLFAKFRGVANATQSTFDGKPEIAAVHAGWCLANHCCAPNVGWSPTGVRRFWVRDGGLVGDGDEMGGGRGKGIKKGEEIWSHYTDVRLGVKERRERLREVLGGLCRCGRCLTESGEDRDGM